MSDHTASEDAKVIRKAIKFDWVEGFNLKDFFPGDVVLVQGTYGPDPNWTDGEFDGPF